MIFRHRARPRRTWSSRPPRPHRTTARRPAWSRVAAPAVQGASLALVLAILLAALVPQQDAAAQGTPPPAGTLAGLVFEDANRNGSLDPNEPRIPGVTVVVAPIGTPGGARTAATDAAGQFRFEGLAAGSYAVAVTPPAGGTPTTSNPQTVTLGTGAGRDDLRFGLAFPAATPTPGADLAIGGIVFDDRDRDGRRDAGEGGIAGVQVQLRRSESGSLQATAVTGSDGRYRFGNLAAGTYVVTTDRPSSTITTSPSVSAVVPPSQDNVDFGVNAAGPIATLTPTPGGTSVISGVVFEDDDRDGRRDSGEDELSGIEVILRRADTGVIQSTSRTGSDGRYRFGNLAPGRYSVDVENRAVTTPTPRTIEVPPSDTDVNIGLEPTTRRVNVEGTVCEDSNGNRACDQGEPRLSSVSIEIVPQSGGGSRRSTTTNQQGFYRFEDVEAGITYTFTVTAPASVAASGTFTIPIPESAVSPFIVDFYLQRPSQATATAAAQATSTARNGGAPGLAATSVANVFGTPGARGTATPERRMAARRLNGLLPRLTRFSMRSVTHQGGGGRVDAAADGAIIPPDRLAMRLSRNERLQELIVIGDQAYVKSAETGNQWTTIPFAQLRSEIEPLAPLDVLRALQFVEVAEEGGEVVVDGVPTTYYVGDVNTLALWEFTRQGGQGSQGGRGGGDAAEPAAREMRVHAWVGREDRIVRASRMTANVLPAISDPGQIPDPVEFDAQFIFSEPERPFRIVAPTIPTATPVPSPPANGAAAPGQVPPNGGLANGNGRNGPGTPVPSPGIGRNGTPGLGPDFLTPEPLPGEELPPDVEEGLPPVEAPSQREQVLAAERALVGLATGGPPRTGSIARGNQIQLDVPWRTQQDNTAYAPTNSGPASLASVLGAYGTDVAVPDLRALMNGLDSNYNPNATPRVETIARVAERGGLQVLDLYRGPRFNEWTVEQVRESLRRGYPVMTLVQGAVLPGGTPPGAARERWITIVGQDGDELIYHDPAYPNEGDGAARRINPRTLEQGWLAASTPRLGMALAQGPEARGLLDVARGQPEQGTPVASPSPSPDLQATVPVIGTIAATLPPATTDNPWGLPVHPVLIVFWVLLLLLLLAILLRGLR